VERHLHPGDRRGHRDRASRDHRATGRVRVPPHGEWRPHEDREREQRAEALHGEGDGHGEQHQESEPDERRAEPPGGRAGRVERERYQRAVQDGECGATKREQCGRRGEVAAGRAQRVAEEQLLESLRRLGRHRQERAEAHQAGHGDRGAGVGAGTGVARREGDQARRGERSARSAEQQRRAGQCRQHEARQQAVGERLRRIGEALGDHPEAERAAERADQCQLGERPAVDAGAEGVEEEVDDLHVNGRVRGAGSSPRRRPPA